MACTSLNPDRFLKGKKDLRSKPEERIKGLVLCHVKEKQHPRGLWAPDATVAMSAPDADSGGGGLGAEGPRRRGVPSEGGEAAVGGGGVAGVPVGAGARRTTKPGLRRNDQPNLRLMAVIITIPLASLGVLLPFLRYAEEPGVATKP